MSIFNVPEFKVGLLVLVVAGIITTMSIRVSENPNYLGSTKRTWFLIDDAGGLIRNSNVSMAGISVGVIGDVRLQAGQARVELVLRSDTPVTRSARIEIRPNGILGDKHVEVVAGDPRDPPLREGEQILVVDDRASVDRLITEVSKITKSLSAVSDNIRSATEGDNDKPLGKIIANIESLTTDLADLTKRRKNQVGDIIDSVNNITHTVDQLVNDRSDEGFQAAWKDALKSLRRIETSLKNVEEITGKVNRGEGTLGKLINDEKTVEELNTAIEGVNNYLDSGQKLQTSVDFHSDYLTKSGFARSTIGLNIQPGLDRYYEVGLVDDPQGVTQTTRTITKGSGISTDIREEKHQLNRLKFNALFGKNFYDWTLRGGVIENTGGFGIDYYLARRRLRLSVEAFDFNPHVRARASMRFSLFRGLYITGGGDDLASPNNNASAFLGGGLFLTNDDFKMLMSRVNF